MSSSWVEALSPIGNVPPGQAFCGNRSALLPDRTTVDLVEGTPTPPAGFAPTVPTPHGWLEVATDDRGRQRAAWQTSGVYEALQALDMHQPGKALLTPEFAAGFMVVRPVEGAGYGAINHRLRSRYRQGCSLPIQTQSRRLLQHFEDIQLVSAQAAQLRAGSQSITTQLVVPAKAYWLNLVLADTKAGKPCLREVPAHKVQAGAFVVADGYVGLPELDVPPASTVTCATPFWSDSTCGHSGTPDALRMVAFIRPGEVLYLGWEYGLAFDGQQVSECSTFL